MSFEYTWKLLHILWIVPTFGLMVYVASYKRVDILKKIFGNNANYAVNTTLSPGRRYLRLWLLLLAISLLCVAMARPRWGWRILPFSDRGRDLMIVLDVSKSMRSEDVRPTRLKHAKLLIRNLIKSNPGDRFGLIAFAGSAFLECPLTVDKTSIFQTLDEISTDSIPLGGTNIENALETALIAFQAAEGGYRAIVLISDGDELSGDSSKSVAMLKKLKIPLFVVGIGDPSGDGLIKMTGPDGKTRLLRDAQGELVISRLNEVQLKKLYKATNGIYVRSTATEPELAAINKHVKQLIPKEYSKSSSKRPIEKFHYPLFVAIILLLIRFGIGERRKERVMVTILCLAFITGFTPTASAEEGLQQNKEKQKLAVEATVDDGDSQKKKTNEKVTPASLYNRALKLHIESNKDEAKKLYKKAINLAEIAPEVRSKAFQNLGVIAHTRAREIMQKDPDKALEIMDQAEIMYKEAMRSDTKRKRVILNQQKLLDDRILAKKIKDLKEELEKKQKEAQKQAKEAHDQQKKENDQKKNPKKDQEQKQQEKEQEKQKQKQKEKQKQSQEARDNQKQQSNSAKNKQDQKKSKSNPEEREQKSTEEKIKDAKKACDKLKDAAERHKRPDVKKIAEEAKSELNKAEEEHKKSNGKKAEEHLKKAMDQLKPGKEEQKDKENKGQQNKDQKDKSKENDKKKKGEEQDADGNKKLKKQEPEKNKDGEGKDEEASKEKPIDPRQAATLLEMMANDEKTLRDKIKENQKRNTRVKKVLKDW